MSIANADIAAVFDEIADLLDIQGANAFRIRAYRNAARMLGGLGRSVREMVEHGEDLDALPGIGPDLASKIAEIAATGHCALLERLRKELPPEITALLKIPGLGPRRVRLLHDELGVETLEQLRAAAQDGRISGVHGFGLKTQQRILDAVQSRLQQERRVKLSVAVQVADAILAELAGVPGVKQAVAAGSLRRQRDTVGDLDLLVTIERGSPVMERFTRSSQVERVLSRGITRASVVLRSGLQVDLRAVPPASFGAAWLYFTGSKAHTIALRKLAQDVGLKLNEYGAYRGSRRIAGDTEASVYAALGLPFITPELREDRGEIEAARARALPVLVNLSDLRGDLHAHTRESDGRDSLEAMALAARRRGFEYLAITEHSARLAMARGLDAERLARQIDDIDELNARLEGITLLKGIEVDILEDGRLDLPDTVLTRLDLVVGAIHHRFDLPRERQTERLLRAMDRPHFSLLAHPTGRLLDERPACDIDLPRVLRKARERGCFVELNAQPERLDLDDPACRMARDEGVLVAIDSDAHSVDDFAHLRFGIGQAGRGWLRAADVLNTRPLAELRPLLEATMGRSSRPASPQPAVRADQMAGAR
ncbi:MAG: DNA polymerase/3'-5' exonuclease PolX [Proteobacteria bacterium]|nr:DNA polymerase/3'-5' exonuclease PolX [Pseudomonadota bacterium]